MSPDQLAQMLKIFIDNKRGDAKSLFELKKQIGATYKDCRRDDNVELHFLRAMQTIAPLMDKAELDKLLKMVYEESDQSFLNKRKPDFARFIEEIHPLIEDVAWKPFPASFSEQVLPKVLKGVEINGATLSQIAVGFEISYTYLLKGFISLWKHEDESQRLQAFDAYLEQLHSIVENNKQDTQRILAGITFSFALFLRKFQDDSFVKNHEKELKGKFLQVFGLETKALEDQKIEELAAVKTKQMEIMKGLGLAYYDRSGSLPFNHIADARKLILDTSYIWDSAPQVDPISTTS